jgi:hypothetical protein
MKQILDKVLDMGKSPMHYVSAEFNTDTKVVFCYISIHLDASPEHEEHRCVCASKYIFKQTDNVQPALDFLNVWAEIFREERELDETDGR